jgi:hypothetical protein
VPDPVNDKAAPEADSDCDGATTELLATTLLGATELFATTLLCTTPLLLATTTLLGATPLLLATTTLLGATPVLLATTTLLGATPVLLAITPLLLGIPVLVPGLDGAEVLLIVIDIENVAFVHSNRSTLALRRSGTIKKIPGNSIE